MSSIQIATPYRRIPVPFVAAMVAAAFALGALAGLGLPRVLDSGSPASEAGVATQAVDGTSGQTMSDAAYQATHNLAPTLATSGQTMSDAAYQATHNLAPRLATSGQTMSDAAYQAVHGRSGGTMSDAAYDAFHGTSPTP